MGEAFFPPLYAFCSFVKKHLPIHMWVSFCGLSILLIGLCVCVISFFENRVVLMTVAVQCDLRSV